MTGPYDTIKLLNFNNFQTVILFLLIFFNIA